MLIYSQHSTIQLSTAHPLWTKIMFYILSELEIDHKILQGHRGKDEQNEYFATGKSKLKWPYSMHNSLPSLAIDVVPYPILWNDHSLRIRTKYTQEMIRLATVIQMVARFEFNTTVRWGGDWNRDWSLMDNIFNDYGHMELIL